MTEMKTKDRVLRVQDLAVHFKVREGLLLNAKTHILKAVNGVSFELNAGETLGIVGESGCGKSTLARAILGLIKPDRGRVLWLGEDLSKLDDEDLRKVISDAIARVNAELSNIEKVRKFIIALEPFTVDNEQMTPTMKVRRHKLREVYGEALEGLY